MGVLEDKERIQVFTWAPQFYHEETQMLKSVPWYQNYRVLALGLLVLTFALVVKLW